jgi:hypothetical protein
MGHHGLSQGQLYLYGQSMLKTKLNLNGIYNTSIYLCVKLYEIRGETEPKRSYILIKREPLYRFAVFFYL